MWSQAKPQNNLKYLVLEHNSPPLAAKCLGTFTEQHRKERLTYPDRLESSAALMNARAEGAAALSAHPPKHMQM